MKVFLFASNPDDTQSLRTDDEVTELQHVFSRVSSDRIEFKPFPAIAFEKIGDEIARGRPDVVHFVAHGETDGLWVSERSAPVKLTADAFVDVIGDYKPKLIYLNACNSSDIAKELAKHVKFTIGTTARIQNDRGIEGDFRLYALAITPSGDCYSVAGTLCEALTNFYEAHLNENTGAKFPKDLTDAMNVLYDNNGARLFTRNSIFNSLLEKKKRQPIENPNSAKKRSSSKKQGHLVKKRQRREALPISQERSRRKVAIGKTSSRSAANSTSV